MKFGPGASERHGVCEKEVCAIVLQCCGTVQAFHGAQMENIGAGVVLGINKKVGEGMGGVQESQTESTSDTLAAGIESQ